MNQHPQQSRIYLQHLRSGQLDNLPLRFLVLLVIALAIMGCARTRPAQIQPVPTNAFIKQWQADLDLRGERITQLHLAADQLIAYTSRNRGYWMTASGGQLKGASRIAPPGHTLYKPIALSDRIVIPTTGSLAAFTFDGRELETYTPARALHGNAAGAGNSVYVGVTMPGSGRLARFDLEPNFRLIWEMYTTDGIVAAPAIVNDAIYSAGIDGRVWACTSARAALWPLEAYSFKTDGPVTADVKADDFGVYIASQDGKLYCLDRDDGKIRWIYYAGVPLVESPIVLADTVYLLVPRHGMVAINKLEGKFAREAMWTCAQARQFLASDEKYVYVRDARNTIVALDRASGRPAFHSRRNDLSVFATNTSTPMIYAATRRGSILGIRPVLKPGAVGEIVWEQTTLRQSLAMR
ncbi:PQQ-binding-like beta-propeller repeat protein [Fontivita pretiosa]|uniref:outer membrane protein assembly factor BamB family protein n=1 Tax=Fontivita pretiosa TaxID=2989684 RepID=UPI003D17649C